MFPGQQPRIFPGMQQRNVMYQQNINSNPAASILGSALAMQQQVQNISVVRQQNMSAAGWGTTVVNRSASIATRQNVPLLQQQQQIQAQLRQQQILQMQNQQLQSQQQIHKIRAQQQLQSLAMSVSGSIGIMNNGQAGGSRSGSAHSKEHVTRTNNYELWKSKGEKAHNEKSSGDSSSKDRERRKRNHSSSKKQTPVENEDPNDPDIESKKRKELDNSDSSDEESSGGSSDSGESSGSSDTDMSDNEATAEADVKEAQENKSSCKSDEKHDERKTEESASTSHPRTASPSHSQSEKYIAAVWGVDDNEPRNTDKGTGERDSDSVKDDLSSDKVDKADDTEVDSQSGIKSSCDLNTNADVVGDDEKELADWSVCKDGETNSDGNKPETNADDNPADITDITPKDETEVNSAADVDMKADNKEDDEKSSQMKKKRKKSKKRKGKKSSKNDSDRLSVGRSPLVSPTQGNQSNIGAQYGGSNTSNGAQIQVLPLQDAAGNYYGELFVQPQPFAAQTPNRHGQHTPTQPRRDSLTQTDQSYLQRTKEMDDLTFHKVNLEIEVLNLQKENLLLERRVLNEKVARLCPKADKEVSACVSDISASVEQQEEESVQSSEAELRDTQSAGEQQANSPSDPSTPELLCDSNLMEESS